MFCMRLTFFFAATCALVSAQLTGPVGPTTSTESKRGIICNVLDYGGSVGSRDIGPAISSAHDNCVKKHPDGSTLYVPPGHYNMSTLVTLNGGKKWAFQLDGVITRTTDKGGHMIIIMNAYDFELYSSTSSGGFQGNGYLSRNRGPRFLRIVDTTFFSIHDLFFVDSPEFHVIVYSSSSGELYNLVIRGADIGGSDGIDITGNNIWVHDVMVTNRDECVCVKSPSSNILIENIWCNQSAGCTIGSLSTDTSITDVTFRNVYTYGGDYMLMIKSNGGSGTVKDVLFDNFIGHGTAYGLDVDQYWNKETPGSGNGVTLWNITARNWQGVVQNGQSRPPIRFRCADDAPCTGMVVDNVQLWSKTGKQRSLCRSAYGQGSCLRDGSSGEYQTMAIDMELPAMPNILTMDGDLSAGFPANEPIPTPTAIPTSFFPDIPQISPLAMNKRS